MQDSKYEDLIDQGIRSYDLNDYQKAIDYLDQAFSIVDESDHSTFVWYQKGLILNKLKRYEEAISCFDRSLKDRQNYADAWRHKAIALRLLGQHEQSLDCVNKGLLIDRYDCKLWEEKWRNCIELDWTVIPPDETEFCRLNAAHLKRIDDFHLINNLVDRFTSFYENVDRDVDISWLYLMELSKHFPTIDNCLDLILNNCPKSIEQAMIASPRPDPSTLDFTVQRIKAIEEMAGKDAGEIKFKLGIKS